MGVFFHVLVFPGRGREQVQQTLSSLAPELVDQYHLSDHNRGTAVQSTFGFGSLPQAASKTLEDTTLLCCVYEDSLWGYELYHKGDCLDLFRTVPDALNDPNTRLTRHTPEQHSGLLARYFDVAPERVLPYLTLWTQEDLDGGGVFACPGDQFPRGNCWQMKDFLRCLDYGNDTAEQEPGKAPASPKSGAETVSPPAGAAPFRPREPVLFHSTDLSRCLPYLKAVRRLPVHRRRLFGLLPPKPAHVEPLSVQNLDAAALERLLEDFFARKTQQLELDMELPGKGIYVRRLKKMVSQPVRFTVELLQEEGRFLCLCLDDEDQYLYWLICDRNAYYNEDCKEHAFTTIAGRSVETYLVHIGPELLRQEVLLMLSNLDKKGEVFNCLDRMGVWSNEWHYRNRKKHQEMRERWCFPER